MVVAEVLHCYNLSLTEILKVLEKFGLNATDESISRTQWFKGIDAALWYDCAELLVSRILEIWRRRYVALLIPLVH